MNLKELDGLYGELLQAAIIYGHHMRYRNADLEKAARLKAKLDNLYTAFIKACDEYQHDNPRNTSTTHR